MQQHIIWSNYNLDYEDWRAEIEEQYPDLDEDQQYMVMLDYNAMYLDDERINLDIDVHNDILCIADLGLWDGRHTGYKELGSNVKDCLVVNHDYATFYVDEDGDFCCDDVHHDGTNHLTFRVWKDNVRDKDILLDKLYFGEATQADIEEFTKPLGPVIGAVYGWEINTKLHDLI